LDGTLADNMEIMFSVYQEFLRGFYLSPTPEEFALLNGPPLPQVVSVLKERHGLGGSLEGLVKTYQEILDASYMRAKPSPGASEILEAAKRSGMFIAIVTSSSYQRTLAWLDRNGLESVIDLIVSGGDCEGKPSPEPYKMALAKLRCSAEQSIAVEDSLQGIQSALSAQLRTFCYSSGPLRIAVPKTVSTITHFGELATFIPQLADRRDAAASNV